MNRHETIKSDPKIIQAQIAKQRSREELREQGEFRSNLKIGLIVGALVSGILGGGILAAKEMKGVIESSLPDGQKGVQEPEKRLVDGEYK